MTLSPLPWIMLAVCAAAIGVAGPVLTRNGEIISRLTGLSQNWVGLALLATATSLPELFTGVSAVTVAGTPDIAVGDVLGSCVFNLLMLVFLDAMSRDDKPVYCSINQGHLLTAAFGIILIAFIGAALLTNQSNVDLAFWQVGVYSPIIVSLYFISLRALFSYEKRNPSIAPVADILPEISLSTAVKRYAGAAIVVIAASTWLPFIGLDIAQEMGWQKSFVGTLIVAATTSLPEFVVTVSALRMGAINLAIGGLLGSNLFDALIIAIDDIAYRKGPLLSSVSPTLAVSAFAGVIMSGIFMVALLYRPVSKIRGTIGWASLSLIMVYLFSSYVIYMDGR